MDKHRIYSVAIEQEPNNADLIRTTFNLPAINCAINALSHPAFSMYVYLCMEQGNKLLRLCKQDFLNKFPVVSDNQYYRALQELVTTGYLIKDEKTDYYKFNPNVGTMTSHVGGHKKEKKYIPHEYPSVFISSDQNASLEELHEIKEDEWYVLPVDCPKRENHNYVYFVKTLGRDLRKNVYKLMNAYGFCVNINGVIPLRRHVENAIIIMCNRALPVSKLGSKKMLKKLPEFETIFEDGEKNKDGILWENVRIENCPDLCEKFEKNGVNNLGVMEIERLNKLLI